MSRARLRVDLSARGSGMGRRVFHYAAFIALALAGCSGRPAGNLTPVADGADNIPGAHRVEVFVATTRSADGAPAGELFTGERGALGYADIEVSIPPDGEREIGQVQWPDRPPGNPLKHFVTLRADRVAAGESSRRLSTGLAAHNGRVLVFVHGFNTRFEEAVYRLAQIAHDSGAPAMPFLFTWPSRGRLLAYGYDRESANYSRDALEQVLRDLAANPGVREIDVLAHSMGNWVTIEALRQMAIRDRRVAPKISSVILAAPDLDVDVFRGQIVSIGPKRPPFVLFSSRDDQALAVSSRVWGDRPRLGAIDPAAEPYRTELASDRIQAIDLTNIKSADALGHGKFAESPEIVRMIGARLAGGQTLTDAREGIGEKLGNVVAGAASSVGHAATIAISAPLAVVDPASRETLSEHADALGHSVGDTLTLSGSPPR